MVARKFCIHPLPSFLAVGFSYICAFHSHYKEGKGWSSPWPVIRLTKSQYSRCFPCSQKALNAVAQEMPDLPFRYCFWRDQVIAAPFCGLSGSGFKLLKPPPGGVTHGATQFLRKWS